MPDFKRKSNSSDSFYDMNDDWSLIEASLAKQYGIRIRQNTSMPWTEFCSLVSGLMPDTPLGQIVSIRAEKDPKIIKNFSPDQKRIHREWKIKQANLKLEDPDKLNKDFEQLGNLMKKLFMKRG